MLTVFFLQYFCMLFSLLLTAVNIYVLTMGGRLRWLWLSSRRPLIFLLCDSLFVESVYVFFQAADF